MPRNRLPFAGTVSPGILVSVLCLFRQAARKALDYMDMHKMKTGGLTVLGLVFALLMILSLPCVAAEQSMTLTLKQALGVALKHNQTLRLRADEVQSARVALRQQKDDFLPEASLEATAGGGHEK